MKFEYLPFISFPSESKMRTSKSYMKNPINAEKRSDILNQIPNLSKQRAPTSAFKIGDSFEKESKYFSEQPIYFRGKYY